MGMNHGGIQPVTDRIFFQLCPDTGLGDPASVTVYEYVTPRPANMVQPFKAVLAHQLGDVDHTYFVVFRINMNAYPLYILSLNLEKLADKHDCGGNY